MLVSSRRPKSKLENNNINYEAKYQYTKVEIIISVSKYIRLVCDHYAQHHRF